MTIIDDSLSVCETPVILQVEVTSTCNLKCKMCPLTTGSTLSSATPGHMTDVLWHQILTLAKRCGNVLMTGYGEPFLNPNFLSLLKDLNQAQVNIYFSTNGLLLTESMARELASIDRITGINFSIDSPQADSYRYIRGGNVEKALNGLRNLMAVIQKPNIVTVSSILMKRNLKDLVGFPAILAEMGVQKWYLQGLVDTNAWCPEYQLRNDHELFAHLDEIQQQCKELGIEAIMTLPERLELERDNPQESLRYFDATAMEPGETRQCSLPWGLPFLDRDGRVFPCCHASKDVTVVMGDLRRESWDEIWNGPRFRKFRKNLLEGGTATPSICQGCNAVRRGQHPLLYAAKILPERSRLSGKGPMKVVVKNIGPYTWTQNDPIYIGTASPRDRSSRLWHSTWIAVNRVAHFQEEQVLPGELATFGFVIDDTEVYPIVKTIFGAK